MAKRKSRLEAPQARRQADVTEAAPALWLEPPLWLAGAALALLTLVFYWTPLTSAGASIQWDAVDTHYSPQKYFSDRIRHGELPHWTPYIFSGFPFLADPQVGAWYPLNWPFFFVTGITPGVIQFQLVLHAFLACLGTFLLLRRLTGAPLAALAGAIAYGFTGYFADHASHVGMFAAAALLPWLLLCFELAMQSKAVRFGVFGGLTAGAIVLAGHFQNALYCFAALGLFALARFVAMPDRIVRGAAVVAGIVVVALGASAIQTLPGLELSSQSIRAAADYSQTRERILTGGALGNVAIPTWKANPATTGGTPGEVNYYLYCGLLLLPLAALGVARRDVRVAGLLLIVIPAWFMLGPDAGLYRLAGTAIPPLHKVRAPIHFWFVAAFGLATLAAGGAAWVLARWSRPAAVAAICAILFADLFYWNSAVNRNAYARESFADLYGNKEDVMRTGLMPAMEHGTRLDGPDQLSAFGPMNHPLDVGVQATYGYNPLALRAYTEYREAMKRNPKLMSGLNVSTYLDVSASGARKNDANLPRAYFARSIKQAKDEREAVALLESLDPAQATIVTGAADGVQPSPDGKAEAIEDGEQAYRLKYETGAAALLKLSVPYFPGWTATVDGAPCRIVRADHALIGIVVPAGKKEAIVRFRSNYFGIGALASTATLALAAALLRFARAK